MLIKIEDRPDGQWTWEVSGGMEGSAEGVEPTRCDAISAVDAEVARRNGEHRNPQDQVLKLQLTLPALERLLGGNTNIETQLRDQVARQFVKNHFKSLAKELADSKIRDDIEKTVGNIANAVKQHAERRLEEAILDGKSGTWGNVKLSEKMKATISDHVSKEIGEAMKPYDVAALVEERVKAIIEDRVRRITAQRIDDQVVKVVKEQVLEKMAAAV